MSSTLSLPTTLRCWRPILPDALTSKPGIVLHLWHTSGVRTAQLSLSIKTFLPFLTNLECLGFLATNPSGTTRMPFLMR